MSNEFTTEKFDDKFGGKISTLTTDKTFSWIISTDIANYNPLKYLAFEFLTQLLVAFFLSLLLSITAGLDLGQRLLVILIAALAGTTATYGQQLNWWNVPALFQVGMMLNVVVSWMIVSFVSARCIIR